MEAALASAVVALASASAYTGYKAGESSKKQAKAQAQSAEMQEKARQEQVKIEELKIERERRRIMREARIQQGAIVAGAEALGAGTSSAVTGAVSSAQSQGTSNLGFMDATAGLASNANRALGTAAQFSQQAMGFQADAASQSAYSNLFAQGASIANAGLPENYWKSKLGV